MGSIPAEVSLLTALKFFIADNNRIGGTLKAFENMTSLNTIALDNNRLTGTIPSDILAINPEMGVMNLGGNSLSGPLPSSIDAPMLSHLNLWENSLTGSISGRFGTARNLRK